MRCEALLFGGDCGETTFEGSSIKELVEEAVDWAEGGDWDSDLQTCWVDLTLKVYTDEGEPIETIFKQVTIEPEEPLCEGDEDGSHNWVDEHEIVGGIKENPGCWGHGGGVIIQRACTKCGMLREEDTWAQNRNNGQQGLYSIKYVPGHFDILGKEEEE